MKRDHASGNLLYSVCVGVCFFSATLKVRCGPCICLSVSLFIQESSVNQGAINALNFTAPFIDDNFNILFLF